MQIFVRGLTGKHCAVDLRPWETISGLKAQLEAIEGIPCAEQRLVFGGRHLCDDETLESSGLLPGNTVCMLLGLAGGKGGFGSNLRAAGKQKLVDNFDACRDLQGRRIRHKTAAEKLEEWQAEAQERELEKVALRHLKEVEKEERRQEQVEVDVKSVRAATKETLAGVNSAVKYALGKNKKNGSSGGEAEEDKEATEKEKGKKQQPAAKRLRRMDPLALSSSKSEDSDEDSESEEEK